MTCADRALAVDLAACRWLRSLPHAPAGDRLLAAVSRSTDDAIGWIVAGLGRACLDRRQRSAWLAATASVVVADRVSVAIKHAAGRQRPRLDGLPPLASAPSPLSFPSSHTASAAAAAAASADMVAGPWLTTTAILVAVSRPYLGMHYPSDVVAGAAIGVAIGSVGRLVAGHVHTHGCGT